MSIMSSLERILSLAERLELDRAIDRLQLRIDSGDATEETLETLQELLKRRNQQGEIVDEIA